MRSFHGAPDSISEDHESRIQVTQRGRITNMRPLLP